MSACLTTLRNALLERASEELEALVLDPHARLDAQDLTAIDELHNAVALLIVAASTSNAGFERRDLAAPMRGQAARIDHLVAVLHAMHDPKRAS